MIFQIINGTSTMKYKDIYIYIYDSYFYQVILQYFKSNKHTHTYIYLYGPNQTFSIICRDKLKQQHCIKTQKLMGSLIALARARD